MLTPTDPQPAGADPAKVTNHHHSSQPTPNPSGAPPPGGGATEQVAGGHGVIDARRLAVASAVAVLLAATMLACWAGRDAVAAAATTQRLARFTVLMTLPGILLAAAAPSLGRLARVAAAVGGAAAIVGGAVWQREDGGLVLLPAAVLLLAAAFPRRSHVDRDAEAAPTDRGARADLVVMAAMVGFVGLVGRAVALHEDGELGTRLGAVATGLVILAWPLVGAALLPPRLRHRGLLGAAVAVVALVVARAPAGGEAWLVPGAVLLLVAALTEPAAEEEDAVGQF